MKKFVLSLGLAVLLFAGVGLTSGGGVAFAHSDANPNFQGAHADDPSPSPAGSHIIGPGADAGSANGAINGFGTTFNEDGSVTLDPSNPANIGITHNPNCPLHHHD